MALSFPDYSFIAQGDGNPIGDAFKNIYGALQQGKAQQADAHLNAIKAALNEKYGPQDYESQIRSRQAQSAYNNQMAADLKDKLAFYKNNPWARISPEAAEIYEAARGAPTTPNPPGASNKPPPPVNSPSAGIPPDLLSTALSNASQTGMPMPGDGQGMFNNTAPNVSDNQSMAGGQQNVPPPPVVRQRPEQELMNQFIKAKLNGMNALAGYRNMGGRNIGVKTNEDLAFQNSVAMDNPQITDPQKLREAVDVVASGGTQLSDGTPVNPPSLITQRAYDRAFGNTTTASLITAGVKANQADAELNALNDHVAPVIKDFGTTYFNKSPSQIIDSFSSDPASQKRLGRIIGARSLQYAIAQLRNRIDMGEPGINATRELMNNSGELIDSMAPRLTPEARQEALNFINEGVAKSLKARNSYGVGASKASGSANPSSKVKNFTQAQLEYTAKKHNVSIEKVKRDLGIA